MINFLAKMASRKRDTSKLIEPRICTV